MSGLEGGGDFSAEFANVVLLILWAALPGLVLGYLRQARAVRRTRSEFTLCRSEAAELNRAIRLFDQVCRRLEELERPSAARRLWPILLSLDADHASADVEERHDLEAYAEHLQATILQLKRRPLRRLRSWIRMISTHDALCGAIAVYFIGLAFTVTASNFLEEVSLILANGAAAVGAAIAALLIYPVRRVRLRRQHVLEFHVFKDLARSDVEPVLEPEVADRPVVEAIDSWSAVLGVSPAANIDRIREAYKALIKQNHPDRVHGMSPAFSALAEAETKRINAAYQQALACAPRLAPECHAA
jgi:DnaJ domain